MKLKQVVLAVVLLVLSVAAVRPKVLDRDAYMVGFVSGQLSAYSRVIAVQTKHDYSLMTERLLTAQMRAAYTADSLHEARLPGWAATVAP